MSIEQINPYLNFNGTAGQAIALYERALGARVESMMRYADAPKEMKLAPEHEGRVMHAQLRIGKGVVMVSDMMSDERVAAEGNVQVLLDFDDPTDLTQKYEALAAGGKATLPPHDAFWGAKFGMLTDAYGVCWLFHCELKKG